MFCQIKYTPVPKTWVFPDETRQKADQMYVDGINLFRVARHLGLHHRTVSLRVQARAGPLPDAPIATHVKETDDLFIFIGDKKSQTLVVTIVDCLIRCHLGFLVMRKRTQATIHEIVDEAPNPKQLVRRSRCFRPCP